MFAHLHVRSWYSFRAGGSSPDDLARRASELGVEAMAITDRQGLQGAVQFQQACEEVGIKPIFGAEVTVEEHDLVLLAENREGYSNLCDLLSESHLQSQDRSSASLDEVEARAHSLFCLTGTDRSRLWKLVDNRRWTAARSWLQTLHTIFGDHLSIEIASQLLPGDTTRMRRLARLSENTGVPLLATGDIRYSVRGHYQRYDLLTCIRLGTSVFESHPERPKNGEAFLRPERTLRSLIPYPRAFERTSEVAEACTVDLLPERIRTPEAQYESNEPPQEYLRNLCGSALQTRYSDEARDAARSQLEEELETIGSLQLSEFFLVVREVVQAARDRGIRCAGRGSAANSIVAYLLGITGVDPIEHNLLFERFLHRGRKGTPDIDVDFDSARREEVVQWMEQRFGVEQTAMTATVVRYRLRSAIRDVGKALDWPLGVVDDLTALVPRREAGQVTEYREIIKRKLESSPLAETLIRMTASLDNCPRHLGLHSGGMVLSHEPLHHFSPVQTSANGVRMIQFDKRDVESLGLVKLDVLGLRMLATISETQALIDRHHEDPIDIDDVPKDDPETFELIQSGQVVGLFQIESQGQHHLLAQHQPERFEDLINEVALFRPGPLQGNMVHPFVRRRRGEERVRYDHPILEPILEDTYGVILFQEQVLEVAHQFAGMPLEEADDFRELMTDFRDPEEMERMRERFVDGAIANGVDPETAHKVFDQVAGFVGYGFCRSHAAAFAKTVYQSAYLKAHCPAAFMAAVMEHRPGMYNQMTLEEEARRFEVPIFGPEINRSGTRFDLEATADGWAIRKPLTSVSNVSMDDARKIVWERLDGRYDSVEDLYQRVALNSETLRSLARSGALDAVSRDGRTALWEVGVLHRRLGQTGRKQQPSLFGQPIVESQDVPDLPELTEKERLSWDLKTHQASRRHPLTLVRRQLNDLEVRPIDMCYRFGESITVQEQGPPPILTVAGISILRQAPSTANGVMFLTLEDETGYIQCVCQPEIRQVYGHVLTSASMIVRGHLQIDGSWCGLVVRNAWHLNGIFGGYEGHPSASGGLDRWVQQPEEAALNLPRS